MTYDGRIRANALHIPLADNSVHCVVTSPPYFSLRSYDIPPTIWGGNQDCIHLWEAKTKVSQHILSQRTSATCTICGAWLGCLGLEDTPDQYVEHMVMVFREVRRVLRADGTCWINLGDSFAAGGHGGGGGSISEASNQFDKCGGYKGRRPPDCWGLKKKDLMMIPHRVAIALQLDGWWVRNDICWEKSQCMPESVRDRCTRSHEYVFHLSKSEKYFYDAEAIKEPASADTHARYARGRSDDHKYAGGGPGQQTIARTLAHMVNGREKVAGVTPKAAPSGSGIRNNESFSAAVKDVVGMRNKRTVWRLSTASFSEAHYATFPPDLVAPCILAGTSTHGCCADCGAPYTREVKPSERYARFLGKSYHDHDSDLSQGMKQMRGDNSQNAFRDEGGLMSAEYQTVGWLKSCSCETDEIRPAIVLDPFFGSGTLGLVAERLCRRWIGLDLGYQDIQGRRVTDVQKELSF